VSYDVDLTIESKTIGGDVVETDVFWRNHTSNTSRMWREAGADLGEFHGKKAGDLTEALYDAIQEMLDDPAKYRAMEAPNGWGSYESTLGFLTAILYACCRYPDAVMGVSR